ncbi:MAG: response regulator [Actinobacteria bacterium]|nr:response regulator [Actinomycetota bacterium]
MSRLLVVDDEVRIVSFVSRALSAEGFTVDGAYDGKRGLELARSGIYDLVVLDLLLPGMDGVSVLKSIIETLPDQRVLVLSALSDVATKVDCLELGALDYLPKPFALAELVARVRARLRQPASRLDGRFLVAGGLRLDLVRRVAELHGKSVPLAQREFLLLQHLMRKRGEICSREQLLSDLWGYSFDPRSNVVDVCVGRLRSKLAPHVVETVRKVGYRIDGP